ncbi:MAG: hypothetical protein V7607_2827 [Solirubrobacteraceae bacterium]
MRRSLLSLAALAAAGIAVVPVSASAAGWNCSAAVLSGQPSGAPLAANAGGATCIASSAGGTAPALPTPLQASAASATTSVTGPAGDPAAQTAGAMAQVSGLAIGIPSNVPIAVPTTNLVVPFVGTFDITSALRTLVPVPTGTLVGVQASSATAVGQCANGSPQLAGSSQTTGVVALGQTLSTDQPVQQAVNVVNATTIDPSLLNPTSLPAPANALSLPVLQPLLDALPSVAVPATVAQVGLTPGSQTFVGGTLTQRGSQLTVSIAGQPVADLALGQVSVSRGDVDCMFSGSGGGGGGGAGAGAGGEQGVDGGALPAAQLACTSRKLALIDVLDRSSYARLYGAADLAYVGRRVDVVSLWNGKVVARPIVLPDGTFQARGALPPKALRQSNRARYQARIGNERSLELKLFRRMVVEEMSSSDGDVTIKGRVLGPLGKPTHAITIKRRVSCTREVTVKSVKPSGSGRFAVTIPAPPTGQAAVYRLSTSVPRNARSPKLFPTFTLPRAVELRR